MEGEGWVIVGGCRASRGVVIAPRPAHGQMPRCQVPSARKRERLLAAPSFRLLTCAFLPSFIPPTISLHQTTDAALEEHFKQIDGEIVWCQVVKDRNTNESKGWVG